MASRVKSDGRRQCSVPACTYLGRLYSCGYRCDTHRPGQSMPLPQPDPERTAAGLRATGHKRDIIRAVCSAMFDGLTEEEVTEAFRAGVRQHSLYYV